MKSTCKNPRCPRKGKPFVSERDGVQYCSGRCRTAAYRRRHKRLPSVYWQGKTPGFRAPREALDGTALSKGALAERLIEIAATGDDGKPKTGRRFYYLALSYGYVCPDMGASEAARKSRDAADDRVTDVLGTLRKQGRLDWDAVLDLTRDLDTWLTYDSARDARASLRGFYNEDRWIGQPFYPILIVEKDTMEPVCKPMARQWQMPFASSRGYASLKLQHDVAELVKHRYAEHGQSTVVFFVSDLDPSGLDLQRAWKQAMEYFGIWHCEFVRIGLTHEQVRDNVDVLGNPLENLAIAVKPSDSRTKRFVELYGSKCWEVDILPPHIIKRTIELEIRSRYNATLWHQRDAEIERARGLL
jgi:hypothetical protein